MAGYQHYLVHPEILNILIQTTKFFNFIYEV